MTKIFRETKFTVVKRSIGSATKKWSLNRYFSLKTSSGKISRGPRRQQWNPYNSRCFGQQGSLPDFMANRTKNNGISVTDAKTQGKKMQTIIMLKRLT